MLLRADRLLRERGELPLTKGLSPHKLRHAFASILVACGTDPASVMRQIGHRSAAFTLDVYTQTMSTLGQRERLKGLVEGERRWGPAPAPRLGSSAYKEPILRVLVNAGGTARRAEVMARIEAEMLGRFGTADREIVWGKPRWQADVDVACRRLRERGLVTRGAKEGVWRLVRARGKGQAARRLGTRGCRAETAGRGEGGGVTVLAASFALIVAWRCGGAALRLAGLITVVGGVVALLASGDPTGVPVAMLGVVSWFLGQLHHLVRHGEARSALARRILEECRRGSVGRSG